MKGIRNEFAVGPRNGIRKDVGEQGFPRVRGVSAIRHCRMRGSTGFSEQFRLGKRTVDQ